MARKEKPFRIPDGWNLTPAGTKLKRTFLFDNYLTAFMFVARISVHAEAINHHPDISLSYGKVVVTLSTHESKSVTSKDIELAKRINRYVDNAQ